MNWLAQLIEKLFCWVPRIWLVAPDEGGVRITASLRKGIRCSSAPPGWYIYWPLIQRCIKVTVTPQVVDLRGQSVMTKDGHDVILSGAIQYRIQDAEKAILAVQDFDRSLQALALGIISEYTGKKEGINRESLAEEILKGIRDAASGWGLKIMQVYITDVGNVKNLRVVGSTLVVPVNGEGIV